MDDYSTPYIRQKRAMQLLSGEELTTEDRKAIAYELGCATLQEQALRHICKRLVSMIEPKQIKTLTASEQEFIKRSFPSNKVGRKKGVKQKTKDILMYYTVMRKDYKTDDECYKAIADLMGMDDINATAVKNIERQVLRARAEHSRPEFEYLGCFDDLAGNINALAIDLMLKAAIKEVKEEKP